MTETTPGYITTTVTAAETPRPGTVEFTYSELVMLTECLNPVPGTFTPGEWPEWQSALAKIEAARLATSPFS